MVHSILSECHKMEPIFPGLLSKKISECDGLESSE